MRNTWSKLKRILLQRLDLRLRPRATSMPYPAPMPCRAAVAASSRCGRHWRQIASPRRLTILFWLYIAQALAGSVVDFTAPFLYYFGFL
jgi:hypothetical protein